MNAIVNHLALDKLSQYGKIIENDEITFEISTVLEGYGTSTQYSSYIDSQSRNFARILPLSVRLISATVTQGSASMFGVRLCAHARSSQNTQFYLFSFRNLIDGQTTITAKISGSFILFNQKVFDTYSNSSGIDWASVGDS